MVGDRRKIDALTRQGHGGGDRQAEARGPVSYQDVPRAGDVASENIDRQRRFVELYDRHGRRVRGWALRRMAPPDADDLLSEAFCVCWRRLDDVPSGDAALPWLFGVAGRLLNNYRRGQRRRDALSARLVDAEGSRPQPVAADDDVRFERLDLAMLRLRPADAEILRLAAWEGLRPPEIGVAMDCTANAASIRLHRARRALAAAYADVEALNEGRP